MTKLTVTAEANLNAAIRCVEDRRDAMKNHALHLDAIFGHLSDAAFEQNPNARTGKVSAETMEEAASILTATLEKLQLLLGDPGKSL